MCVCSGSAPSVAGCDANKRIPKASGCHDMHCSMQKLQKSMPQGNSNNPGWIGLDWTCLTDCGVESVVGENRGCQLAQTSLDHVRELIAPQARLKKLMPVSD